MPTRNYSVSFGGGVNIAKSQSRSADGGSDAEITVPAGVTGTLTTRTDDNTGTITLTASASVTTGANVDIYWDGGVQYNVTIGTVSGTSCPFDSGIGDNLPIATTAVVISVRQQVNMAIDGDELSALAMQMKYASQTATSMSHIDLQESDDTEIAEIDLQPNGVQVWDVTGGSANPFAGDPIAKAFVSNGSSTAAATFLCSWLQDITP